MAAEFCIITGCYEVAVAAARSRKHCRPHYDSEVLAGVELVKFEVTAESPKARVTDARTQVSHGRGSVVELDPAETNIAALVAAGLGKVVPSKPASKPAAKSTQ
ncbi:hypothetical protein ABGB07_03890 [Micromonosporaceae bacterium B7E4]